MQRLRLGFIGAGNMGTALMGGVRARFPDAELWASDPNAARRGDIQRRFAVTPTEDNVALCDFAEVVVLCTKPQLADGVLAELAPHWKGDKLLVSVCAGIDTARIEAALEGPARVIRAMPNTPALVGVGATAIALGKYATRADAASAQQLFESVGLCLEVDEVDIDAVTGLSGSGPAYVLRLLESLIDGGIEVGLSPEVTRQLALQTLLGAATLVRETGEQPGVLRERVTSPGGTTVAGLTALQNGGFRDAVVAAVRAATERSRELGAARSTGPSTKRSSGNNPTK
jgi:pyrroline-5-carboxylate reductase